MEHVTGQDGSVGLFRPFQRPFDGQTRVEWRRSGVIIWGASFRPGDIRRRIDRLALHPSVTQISDKAQRGDFVNAAWRRYGIVNSVSLAAVLAGWIGAGS